MQTNTSMHELLDNRPVFMEGQAVISSNLIRVKHNSRNVLKYTTLAI